MKVKVCTSCNLEKPVTEFYRQKLTSGNSTPMGRCKQCHAADTSARIATYSPEQLAERARKARARSLRRNFGLTIAQYDEMLEDQGGVCKICHEPEVIGRALAVDHDHLSGSVRGLLCFHCNTKLGYFESSDLLPALLDYLQIEVAR